MENTEVSEDVRQSLEYGRYMERIGWRVEGNVFIRQLGPVAIAKIQRIQNIPWEKVNKILKKYHAVVCYFEPLEYDERLRRTSQPFVASKTLKIDLGTMSFKKETRRILRKLEGKYKIDFNNYEKFYEIWKSGAKRKGLWIPSRKSFYALHESFGNKCFCLTINNSAGAFILMHYSVAYYYYAAATEEGTKLNYPYVVVWEAMKEAKRQGCKSWDFEGVYDKRWPNKGWIGFSHFKKSFGGEEVEFPGAFKKYILPF